MKYIDAHERCLLFSLRHIAFMDKNFEASCKLLDEATFWNCLFKQYIINGEYEKARELGECIDNIISCFN